MFKELKEIDDFSHKLSPRRFFGIDTFLISTLMVENDY